MKSIIFLFLILTTVSASCQSIFKGTGTDITVQYNQVLKTNDSLKLALTSTKASLATTKTTVIRLISDSTTLANSNKQLRIDTSVYKTQTKVFRFMSDTLIIANNKLRDRINYWENTNQFDSIQMAYFKNMPSEYFDIQNQILTKKTIWPVVPWFRLQSIVRKKNIDGTMDEYVMTDIGK